jgi:hypothetical protein
MLERAETTLCLVISLAGKITTGSTDNMDSDRARYMFIFSILREEWKEPKILTKHPHDS